MKKIIYFFAIFCMAILKAQNGADIAGLVKINGIQQSNTNRVLLTDGNGNLGYTTFTNLSNVGTVVTSVLNTGVLKTQIAKPAIFRNLPNFTTNRIVTIDSNGSLGYRVLNSSGNATALTGTLGLQASNLINLGAGIFSAPTTYTYIVTVDNNGVLGKMPLANVTTVTNSCSPTWTTTGYGAWGAWNGCNRYRDIYQSRTCYYLDGSSYTATQTLTQADVDNTGCNIVTGSCSAYSDYGSATWGAWNGCSRTGTQPTVRYCTQVNGVSVPQYSSRTVTDNTGCNIVTGSCGSWTTVAGTQTAWVCTPGNVNQQQRTYTRVRTCTQVNGQTTSDYEYNVVETRVNAAPVANMAWWPAYRTITMNVEAFSSDSDGTIASYTVDWGDGTVTTYPVSGNLIQHTYANPSTTAPVSKTVKLTVTDNCGRVSAQYSELISTSSRTVNYSYTAVHRSYGYDNSGTTGGDSNFLGSMDVYQSGNNIMIKGRFGLFIPGTEGAEGGNHSVYFTENSTNTTINYYNSANIKVPGGNGYCQQGDILYSNLPLPAGAFNVLITNYFGNQTSTNTNNILASYVKVFMWNGDSPNGAFLDECVINTPRSFTFDLDAPQILNGYLYTEVYQYYDVTFSVPEY